MLQPPKVPTTFFKTGLFSVFDDVRVCCFGACCPCCLYGDNVNRLNGGTGYLPHCCLMMLCPCFSCLYAGKTRAELRSKYGLHEEPCSDCVVHCFCVCCGICQEAREMKFRGY